MEPTRIPVDELRQRLQRKEDLVLVDARSEHAWRESREKAAGALRVPPDDVATHVNEIGRDKAVVTYCT
jgi:rhodanese-related sulfurtransferase